MARGLAFVVGGARRERRESPVSKKYLITMTFFANNVRSHCKHLRRTPYVADEFSRGRGVKHWSIIHQPGGNDDQPGGTALIALTDCVVGSSPASAIGARAEDPFKMAKHVHVRVQPPAADARHAEAAKTTRLRALRLEKEAADREAASRAAALTAAAPRRAQASRSAPRPKASTPGGPLID